MTTPEQLLPHFLHHCRTHPRMTPQDGLKFLHQSAFGCEHMVRSLPDAVDRIRREVATDPAPVGDEIEPLDGNYSRISLEYLNRGLSAERLAALFFLSAKVESEGLSTLEQTLSIAEELAFSGLLPFDGPSFSLARREWKQQGYPSLHHSEEYRQAYRPAYRVISNRFIPFLPVLIRMDQLLASGGGLVAIEGGSASGKSTLGDLLEQLYSCTLLHTDDFFLQPHQRTEPRLQEPGGNLDRERFLEEVLLPARKKELIAYRRYDCQTGALQPPIPLQPTPLTVVEGAYSLHPELRGLYDLTFFLEIPPQLQRQRIQKRNTPDFARRFFEEWIPMENRYFDHFHIRDDCDLVIPIE